MEIIIISYYDVTLIIDERELVSFQVLSFFSSSFDYFLTVDDKKQQNIWSFITAEVFQLGALK